MAPFFCLSLFSWFPLLLKRVQYSNNAQGFLYYHSWQLLSCPCPSGFFCFTAHPPFKNIAFCNVILTHQTQGGLNKSWSSSSSPLNLSYQPTLLWASQHSQASVSLAKARQRGWAAKHSAQWHMLCGFLGTGWRTVLLLCQASLYCRGPLGCSSPGHSRGWKGISLGSNWKDATLNSANASILYSCTVVAELLTVAMDEAGPLSWDKSLHRTTLPLR